MYSMVTSQQYCTICLEVIKIFYLKYSPYTHTHELIMWGADVLIFVGYHFAEHTCVKSSCYIPKAYTMLYVNYIATQLGKRYANVHPHHPPKNRNHGAHGSPQETTREKRIFGLPYLTDSLKIKDVQKVVCSTSQNLCLSMIFKEYDGAVYLLDIAEHKAGLYHFSSFSTEVKVCNRLSLCCNKWRDNHSKMWLRIIRALVFTTRS